MAGIWICVCALLSAAFFTSTSATTYKEDLLGLPVDVDVTNIHVQKAVEFLKQHLSLTSGQKLIVEKAQRQAVAGLKLCLTIKIESEMLNTSTSCEIIVYSRPWINHMDIAYNGCSI
ncbi:cystatin-like [Rhincodon typus]|uniref:cystatin-like n=1 Tax=Rhincodon typus TaxID=259920 RepID=UPI0020303DC2|nr:cystatin-like [Rhincodon typus]XP_048457386.1 cystatin-like [Rhincodon typus]